MSSDQLSLLSQPYQLSSDQITSYHQNRYIKLKNTLDLTIVNHFDQVVSKRVKSLSQGILPLDQRDTYGKAFLQLTNLWTQDDEIKELVFSKRLAQIAADLMQVDGVRLYHDQALFKEVGGGITPWHADQFYWPLQTDKTITAWIPLQATPLEMGPLEFSAGSHKLEAGRDLMISDESETTMSRKLRVTDFPHICEPFEMGEVSFHSGWIFHRAGANRSDRMRKVMTIIYMDKDMILKAPENDNQILDWKTWCPGANVGEVIDTPLNPVLFTRSIMD